MRKKKDGIILQKKNLSALLHDATPTHKSEFYCLNGLQSFKTEINLNLI